MNHPSTTRGWNRVTLSLLAVCLVFSTSVRALDAGNTDVVLVKHRSNLGTTLQVR